jgi:hypothetical protein
MDCRISAFLIIIIHVIIIHECEADTRIHGEFSVLLLQVVMDNALCNIPGMLATATLAY